MVRRRLLAGGRYRAEPLKLTQARLSRARCSGRCDVGVDRRGMGEREGLLGFFSGVSLQLTSGRETQIFAHSHISLRGRDPDFSLSVFVEPDADLAISHARSAYPQRLIL